jgi:hypothetical protein
MRRRRKKAHAQPVREMSDTAKWAVVGMGAAILAGVFYLLLKDDPSAPKPVGSQVPDKLPAPQPAPPILTISTTYSATAANGSSFVLKVGDTIAFRPPSPNGGMWTNAKFPSSGGVIHPAGIADLGVQPDGTYVFRMDSPGQSTLSVGYMANGVGTINMTMAMTVTP